jgi:hypothetical protein
MEDSPSERSQLKLDGTVSKSAPNCQHRRLYFQTKKEEGDMPPSFTFDLLNS